MESEDNVLAKLEMRHKPILGKCKLYWLSHKMKCEPILSDLHDGVWDIGWG